VAVTSAIFGAHWDIAWHRSIGRDTFWSPPHMAIYLCGVVGAATAIALIFGTTFGKRARLAPASVRVWGFRGPLGAFVMAWGGVAMLTSAPFDDWWHGAYGIDVKIISPPHALLGAGIAAVGVGALLLVLGHLNRAEAGERAPLRGLFLYLGALILCFEMVFMLEHTDRVVMHNADFYRDVAIAAPMALIGLGRASGHRFGSTIVAAIYSLFLIALLWIFPLVPATPRLGPVYYPVTHLIPAPFPLLLMVPALGLDLLRARTGGWPAWQQAIVGGALYFALFLIAQWPFADFLMAPAARNWVFGTHYFDYNTRPNWLSLQHRFWLQHAPPLGWAVGVGVAIVSARLGLGWAAWMERVKR